MEKQFLWQSCVSVLPLIKWQVNGSMFLMNVLPDVYICPLREKIVSLPPEGAVRCTHLAAQFTETAN